MATRRRNLIIAFLKKNYASVDDIDYYVGIFAEDRQENTPLPALIQRMVAVDAFSQALTNPLLSRHVFNVETFTNYGWDTIHKTASLGQILERNCSEIGETEISMTWSGWRYVW